MAKDTKVGKSETLTIRLDPKTRFILEYLSRLKGQTITTVVERAIMKTADQETIQEEFHEYHWQDFWDVSEGVRNLKIAQRPEFYPTFEEEKRLAFCKEHWPFFWTGKDFRTFISYYIEVLWPHIDVYLQLHENSKTENYFAAGYAMQAALSAAKLKPPTWPIQKAKSDTSTPVDEIPF